MQARAPAGRIGRERFASGVRNRLAQSVLGLRIGRRIELDQGELDLDVGHRVEIFDVEHVDHPLELREDLAQVPVVSTDRDRHPRTTGLVGRSDRQRLDVEAACPQQPRDAVERAGSIDDERADHVPPLDGIRLAGGNRGGPRRANRHSAPPSTMSERPLPGSIIG